MKKDPARAAIQTGLKILSRFEKPGWVFSPGKRAKKPEKIPCNRNGISAWAEKQEKRWLPLRSRSDFSGIKAIKWRISNGI